MPQFTLDSLTLPEQLPVSLPSALVRQRPDIRASEEALHQASAAIGVATAAQYPQFTLSGSYGSSAKASASCLMRIPRPGIWPASRSPSFNGGALSAKRRAAEAAYDGAAAQYRATVLAAFQNVADSCARSMRCGGAESAGGS
jgi:outer membrane protein TolC